MPAEIVFSGYRPGDLAAVVALHALFYSRNWGFGRPFETKVATELAAFLRREDPERDLFICARQGEADGAPVVGSVTLDGGDLEEGLAHLRWFIVADGLRGIGLGRHLIDRAVAFARDRGHAGVFLTTFAGLDAARHLYERQGFTLTAESAVDQWSGGVREQRFELRFR